MIRQVSGSAHFVNLDEIARGLSPLDPTLGRERASRVALHQIKSFIETRYTFSLETTLAGRTHLRTLQDARSAGFAIRLLLFFVQTPEICLSRIARRVVEGGHDVPEADVRQRIDRAIGNLPEYTSLTDLWRVMDNTIAAPVTVAE